MKFTKEISKEQINFLDVNISKKEGALQTDLYCRLTDAHQFQHFRSFHRYVYKISYDRLFSLGELGFDPE